MTIVNLKKPCNIIGQLHFCPPSNKSQKYAEITYFGRYKHKDNGYLNMFQNKNMFVTN